MSQTTSPAPYVVEMLMLDGTPDGIRLVSIDNWNGTGVAFSRFDTARAIKRPEMDRAGVYLLAGLSQDDDSPASIYVGESDFVGSRISQHASTAESKSYWEHTVAFTSPELNKAHAKWLEAQLIKLASEAGRAQLENKKGGYDGGLSEVEEARAATFLSRLLLALPLLGIDAFQSSAQQPNSSDGLPVLFSFQDVEASAIWSADGMRILAGSTARLKTNPSIPQSALKRRALLLDEGILVPDGEVLRFTKDYLVSTPSGASQIVYGGASNGWEAWKTEDGREMWKAVSKDPADGSASVEAG